MRLLGALLILLLAACNQIKVDCGTGKVEVQSQFGNSQSDAMAARSALDGCRK